MMVTRLATCRRFVPHSKIHGDVPACRLRCLKVYKVYCDDNSDGTSVTLTAKDALATVTWSQSLLHRTIIACSWQHIINGAGALVVLHVLVSKSIVSAVCFLKRFDIDVVVGDLYVKLVPYN